MYISLTIIAFDDNRLFITCMTLDGHIIQFILRCITLFLTPRQPSLPKVYERHTLPTGIWILSWVQTVCVGIFVRKILGKLRDDNFLNSEEAINTLPRTMLCRIQCISTFYHHDGGERVCCLTLTVFLTSRYHSLVYSV